jgi:hypothetical protein
MARQLNKQTFGIPSADVLANIEASDKCASFKRQAMASKPSLQIWRPDLWLLSLASRRKYTDAFRRPSDGIQPPHYRSATITIDRVCRDGGPLISTRIFPA